MSPHRQDDRLARLEKIRDIVQEDFGRVLQAQNAYEVLNTTKAEDLHDIEERYHRYERFYRPENFQRLGDIDLTRKALDIRRAIGRAILDIRQDKANRPATAAPHGQSHDASLFSLNEDKTAMADIYKRDGMTYLKLGDLGAAYQFFKTSVDLNSNDGLALAYLGYTLHKSKFFEPSAREDAQELLDRAAQINPNNPDIFILRGRFFARLKDIPNLHATIEHIEHIDPTHAMIDRLQRKLHHLLD